MLTEDLYDNMVHFTHYQIVRLGSGSSVDKHEVVHNIISSPDFNENDWKKQIMGVLFSFIGAKKNNHFRLDLPIPSVENVTMHCHICNESYPHDYFISGYNKTKQNFNYRKPCRICYNKTVRNSDNYKAQRNKAFNEWATENYGSLAEFGKVRRQLNKENGIIDATAKERNKRFMVKQREELGDYYIKRLLLDRKKYTKEQITPELINEKRKQISEKRRSKAWR